MLALQNSKRESLLGQIDSDVDLVLILTEADPETRILVQIFQLGAMQEKPVQTWASGTGKKRHPIKHDIKPALTAGDQRLIYWGN